MNQGGEPGHDDYGLPRVDIEIPDDARELDRDVQAYFRELRALRRHERSRRWRAPLSKSGALLPVIAACLVLAMLAGMVLTMFSSSSYFSGAPGQRQNGSTAGSQGNLRTTSPAAPSGGATAPGTSGPGPSAPGASAPGAPAARLPGKAISVSGKAVVLSSLTSTALVIVPGHCGCRAAVRQLLAQARTAGVIVYLVGSTASRTELLRLADGSAGRTALIATDARNVLADAYRPSGLTLLLVDSRGAVTVRDRLRAGLKLGPALQSLRSPG